MLSVEIGVYGYIDKDWSEWFEGFVVEHGEEETIMTGILADQSALYGMLAKLRDLGGTIASFGETW